jgi:drug/metabolite transporter (DMT)-like permease
LAGFSVLVLGMLQAVKEVKRVGWRPESFRAPVGACLFEGACVGADRVLFYSAVLMIGPVEAAGLNYIWIPAVIWYGLLRAGGKGGARYWIGGLCVATGAAAIAVGGIEAGHVLALGAGLVWAWYVIKGTLVSGRGGEASAIGYMAAGGLIVLLAFVAGNRWEIQTSDVLWFGGLLLVSNVGFVLWEFGVKHGDSRAGKIAVLFAPLMAVVWIWCLKAGAADAIDLFAIAAITLAGLILSPHVFRGAKRV